MAFTLSIPLGQLKAPGWEQLRKRTLRLYRMTNAAMALYEVGLEWDNIARFFVAAKLASAEYAHNIVNLTRANYPHELKPCMLRTIGGIKQRSGWQPRKNPYYGTKAT